MKVYGGHMLIQILYDKTVDVGKILTPEKHSRKTTQYNNIKEYLPENKWLVIYR